MNWMLSSSNYLMSVINYPRVFAVLASPLQVIFLNNSGLDFSILVEDNQLELLEYLLYLVENNIFR